MIYLILATLLLTLLTIFAAAASRTLNSNVTTAIIHTTSVFVPLIATLPLIVKKELSLNKWGVLMALAAGIAVGFYGLTINKAFTVNKLGVVAPAVFGGAILLSAIAGYFLFKEKLNMIEFIGLIFVLLGFCIIIFARAQSGYEA